MIAIVDDNTEIADALSDWVSLLGLDATVHYSAENLLEWLQISLAKSGNDPVNTGNVLDAAIIDINLSGINGIELTHKLRLKFPDLPLLLVSALRHDEVESLGRLPLGVSFLRKPFDLGLIEDFLLQKSD
ncbi:MAG: response regulator [Methylococcaceae bacterium]